MDAGTASQLITAGATISAVVMTLLSNAYLERRRARDAHNLELIRHASGHANWLRDERVTAYSALSTQGEEVLQFIRSELPNLIEPDSVRQREQADARWRVLRTELRKAYNQVVLFGDDDARAAGLELWRTARNTGNDLLHFPSASTEGTAGQPDLGQQIRAAGSHLGAVGERFLNACRADLQRSST
jgi:hypothetical protein